MIDVIADFLNDTTATAAADVVVDDGIERDRYGRYLIPAEDDPKKKVAHTRATTVAKTLSDTYNLELWGKRMTAIGLTRRADLYARVAACDPDDRKTLNALLEEAQEAAAATVGRNLGTALHSFTERHDRGDDVSAVPAPWDADLRAYALELRQRHVTVVPSMIERVVVLEELGIAGTFDRLLQVPRLGSLPVVGDLKTAKELYELGEIAMQLALYAHGDFIWNPKTKTREPMPEVNKEQAIVMHLPPGQATCTLLVVDIVAGWEAVQQAMWARDWRNRSKKLGTLLADLPDIIAAADLGQLLDPPATNGATAEPEPAPAVDDLEAMLAAPAVPKRDTAADEPQKIDPGPTGLAVAVAHLGERLKAAVDLGTPAYLIRWPAGVPTFKQGGPTTWAQVLEVEACVVAAEKECEAPFYDNIPKEPGPLGRQPNTIEPPSEAEIQPRPPKADVDDIDRLKATYDSLPIDLRAEADALCANHGVPTRQHNWTPEHAEFIRDVLAAKVAQGVARVQAVEHIASEFDEPSMLAAIKQAAHVDADTPNARLDGLAVERLEAVVRALEIDHLDFTWDDHTPAVTLSTVGDVALTRSFKTKTELVTVAKTAAARHGLVAPRSAAQVAADVALVALVLYGPDGEG